MPTQYKAYNDNLELLSDCGPFQTLAAARACIENRFFAGNTSNAEEQPKTREGEFTTWQVIADSDEEFDAYYIIEEVN